MGADRLDGGAGMDTAYYGGNPGAVWIDLTTGIGKWGWGEGDVLTSIENVIGTSHDVRLDGSAAANRLYGGEGADLITGGARSEEHTSELQSLMRISYAVFGLKQNQQLKPTHHSSAHTQAQAHTPHTTKYS